MGNPSRSLQLLQGNRRTSERLSKESGGKHAASAKIGCLNLPNIEIQAAEFGRFVIRAPGDLVNILNEIPPEPAVEIRDYDKPILSGRWKVSVSRVTSGSTIIIFTHPEITILKPLEPFLDAEILSRGDRLRLLKIENATDMSEIDQHFTELVDFPKKIQCRLFVKGIMHLGSFNFDAQTKNMTELNLELTEDFEAVKGEQVRIEYVFLTVKYILLCEVLELDSDFKILAAQFPNWILALTSRRFDRRNCQLDVTLRASEADTEISGTLVSCSVIGGSIEIKDKNSITQGRDYVMSLPSMEERINIKCRSVEKNIIGFSFVDSEVKMTVIRKIYNQTISLPLVFRDESNFELFEEFYKKIGYGPKESENKDKWVEKTRSAWRFQDRVLPGNSIGTLSNPGLSMSFGILPMGGKIAYGHSLAMDRSFSSIEHFLDIMTINLAFTELIDSVLYYAGSAKTKSHFSARIHSIFECHARPLSHQLLYASGVYGPLQQDTSCPTNYKVSEAKIDASEVPPSVRVLWSLMLESHPLTQEVHKIRHFRVVDSSTGGVKAWIIGHDSPDYFTAANIFKIAFCFLENPEIDINQIYSAILANEFLRNLEINFFNNDLLQIPKLPATSRSQKEVFWWIFSKEEMGPVLASLSRCAWAVMKKYGEDLEPYLKRFVA